MTRIIVPVLGLMAFCLAASSRLVAQDEKSSVKIVPFKVKLDTILKHDDGKFLWFHPRVAAIPGFGAGKNPFVLLTLQKHLEADDHYSGLFTMATEDLGKTWKGPTPVAELDWQKDGKVHIAVADVTPGWHPQKKKVIAIGVQVRYSTAGQQLEDAKRSSQTAFAVYDPQTKGWTRWKRLELPAGEEFDFACSGCAQFVVDADGSVLVPMYVGKNARVPWSIAVIRCAFDGAELKYKEHGKLLHLKEGRGYAEPSLIKFEDKYYLTIRSDARGYAATSTDGLNFDVPRAWTFDDGKELGSYNTQQHWLAHSDGLFLSYTRRGAMNDHVFRHRAPLFLAQVDPGKLQVIRKTEQILMPERGATLGNFGAAPITSQESWVTDAEGVFNRKVAHARGAEGATFVSRVLWSIPNKLVE